MGMVTPAAPGAGRPRHDRACRGRVQALPPGRHIAGGIELTRDARRPAGRRDPETHMGPGRLHALIDGIFAIAMTLLVLDLPRPASSRNLTHELVHQWPAYVAYTVSFVTVGVVWIEHHGMMGGVVRVNRRFLERSLAFLLFVSIIPWPTALAAGSATHGGQARPAAILYASALLMMGVTFAWSWRYLGRHPQLILDATAGAYRAGERRAWLGSLAYLAAIAVALVSADASFAIDAAVAVYFALSVSAVPGIVVREAGGG